MKRVCFCLGAAAVAAAAPAQSFVVGDIRVQALSPRLIRVEQRGPKGFEDRPTFRVVKRDWPGAGARLTTAGGRAFISAPTFRIVVPHNAASLSDVDIQDSAGVALGKVDPLASASVWLPAPGDRPTFWTFGDRPRLIPASQGATPADGDDPTSGWDTQSDAPDVYVFLPGGSYGRLRDDLIALTGPTEMPPLFMLGLIDSKWYPYSEDTALARIADYRKRKIPLDVIVLDTDWRVGASHGYGVNTKLLPDIRRLFSAAHAQGARVMFNDHPEPQAPTALDPKEMRYRWEGLSGRLNEGLDVWWFDRNWHVSLREPMPGIRKEVWGMQVFRDMTLRAKPGQRPVIMANVDGIDNGRRNRPPDVAAHRFPIQWTGDTSSQWSFLRLAVDNAVYSGVHGLNPYVHDDLGGHAGTPTPELYTRFMQYGALCPIMRPHCTYMLERAPWAFGPQAERIVTDYVRLRYRLMPLLYASAAGAMQGEPMLRRADMDYPGHPEAKRNDQYLLGKHLLVAPITEDVRGWPIPPSALKTHDGRPGLRAEYFANKKLEGTPVLWREEASLEHDWGNGQPAIGLPSDGFSVRWTGTIGPIGGTKPITLNFTADDGIRVWLDGELVVDRWVPQDSLVAQASRNLSPDKVHDLKVEYYEEAGQARIRMGAQEPAQARSARDAWIPPGVWTNAWTGENVVGPRTVEATASLSQIPMWVRQGAIVPLAPAMQHTGERPWTPLTLEVWPGVGGFTLYEDDGGSTEYLAGRARRTAISSSTSGGATQVAIAPAKGSYRGALSQRAWTVRLHGRTAKPKEVLVDGKPASFRWIPRGGSMPLAGTGPSPDGAVVEVAVPSAPVTRARRIVVK